MEYNIFDEIVVRAPFYPFNYFINLTKNDSITDAEYFDFFKVPIVAESIYIASPDLYKKISDWTLGKKIEKKELEKLKISFLKYVSRICTRATPFGLFAGCTVYDINQDSNKDASSTRHTKLDMHLLGQLIEKIESQEHIKNKLAFYPNSSLYSISDFYRYIEFENKQKGLVQKVSEVDKSEYLEKIILFCNNGKSIDAIVEYLIIEDSDYSASDYRDFIDELISNQILISEIKLSVSGEDVLSTLIEKIKAIGDIDTANILEQIKNKLYQIDKNLFNEIDKYKEVIKLLQFFELEISEKYVFQVDLYDNNQHFAINNTSIKSQLQEALSFLHSINSNYVSNLSEFKKEFLNRYEYEELPLAKVLDEELGIGYPIKKQNNLDKNPLLDNLFLTYKSSNSSTNTWSEFDYFLLEKLKEVNENSPHITISEKDFESKKLVDLSDTFTLSAKIVDTTEQDNVLVVDGVYASSAASILGRFCQGNEKIKSLTKKITNHEEKINQDKLVAEIVHLPEDRIGNISYRPFLRNFEIPYVSRSSMNLENQININDIMVSLRGDDLILRSKSNGQQILPKLSTAHNYSSSNLSIYAFLCDMQFFKKQKHLTFPWGSHQNILKIFPRVYYKETIISLAKWKLDSKEILNFKKSNNINECIESITNWRKEFNIPNYANLVNGDNKLLINFSNIDSINTLFDEISRNAFFVLEEFLFNPQDVNDKNSVNELIFSFYKKKMKYEKKVYNWG